MNHNLRNAVSTALKSRATETVDCSKELGQSVTLTRLSASEKIAWSEKAYPEGKVDMLQYALGLVSRSILDSEGKRIFSVEEIGDLDEALVDKLHAAALKLNSIGVQAVAEAEGKSDGVPGSLGDSSSLGDSDTRTLT